MANSKRRYDANTWVVVEEVRASTSSLIGDWYTGHALFGGEIEGPV